MEVTADIHRTAVSIMAVIPIPTKEAHTTLKVSSMGLRDNSMKVNKGADRTPGKDSRWGRTTNIKGTRSD